MSQNLDDAVAAHALNALPEDESALVSVAIDFDDELSDEYEAYREVAADLVEGFSNVVPAASPQLWDRIALAAGLESSPGLPPAGAPDVEAQRRSPWRHLAPIIGSVAAFAVAASLTAGIIANRSEPEGLEALALAAAELPGSMTVDLLDPPAGTAVADVVVTTGGEGFIDGSDLPTLAENRTYQLWAIVGDRVISVGLMGNRPDITAFRVEGQLAGLAISEEILGGVVVSEHDPVAVWLDEA